MRLAGNLRKRLADVRSETTALRERLAVLDEQLAYQREVAADATTRAVVASTPLADRERGRAEDDVRRVERARAELAARLEELRAEQDVLLERLFASDAGGQR